MLWTLVGILALIVLVPLAAATVWRFRSGILFVSAYAAAGGLFLWLIAVAPEFGALLALIVAIVVSLMA